jgi:hypothetical protein
MSDSRSFICQARSDQDLKSWLDNLKEVREEIQHRIGVASTDKVIPESLNVKYLKNWTANDVVLWLYCNDLDNLIEPFTKFAVNGERFSMISEANLKTDLGLRDAKLAAAAGKKIQDYCTKKMEEDQKAMEDAGEGLDDDSRPTFINIKDVKVSKFEKDEIRRFSYVVQISWINPSNQSRDKMVTKRYDDFEKFEKNVREKFFPKVNTKLPDRETFLHSLQKKELLERYLQGKNCGSYCSVKDRY